MDKGELCRLCRGKDNLQWAFDEKMASSMTHLISVTSGVEISKNDKVSQMVCNTCCQLVFKMYKFRMKAIKNDTDLKAQYTKNECSKEVEDPDQMEVEVVKQMDIAPRQLKEVTAVKQTPKTTSIIPPKYKFAHPSIKKLIRTYPTLTFPSACLKSHVGAYITLISDEVDDWYRSRNYSDTEIKKIKEAAAKSTTEKQTPQKRKKEVLPKNITKRARTSNESIGKTTAIETLKTFAKTNDENLKVVNGTKSGKLIVKGILESQNVKPKPRSPITSLASATMNSLLSDVATKNAHDDDITLASILKKQAIKIGLITKDTTNDKASETVEPTTGKEGEKTETKSKRNEELQINEALHKKNASNELIKNKEQNKELEKTITTVIAHKDPPKLNDSTNSKEDKIAKAVKSCESKDPSSLSYKSKEKVTNLRKSYEDSFPLSDQNREEIIAKVGKSSESKALSPPSEKTLMPTSPLQIEIGKSFGLAQMCTDIESPSSSSSNENNKSSFVEALNLTPKIAESSNMPDLTLVTVTQKIHTLYTCKVCDSQHSSLKELKRHERRTHTKCAFCRKRFKSLALRDEHVQSLCPVKRKTPKLKTVKLCLVRVDEDEQIKQKYPSAFEKNYEVQEEEVLCDSATADAISELETFLNSSVAAKAVDTSKTAPSASNAKNLSADIICISDDESEEPAPKQKTVTKSTKNQNSSMQIVNKEMVKDLIGTDNDVAILTRILSREHICEKSTFTLANLPKEKIVDGNTPRVKVFKNLRPYLENCIVPITIKYGSELKVSYEPVKKKQVLRRFTTWQNNVIEDLKVVVAPPISRPPVSVITAQSTPQKKVPQKNIPQKNTPQRIAPQTNVRFDKPSTSGQQASVNYQALIPQKGSMNQPTVTNITVAPSISQPQPLLLNGLSSIQNGTQYTNFVLVPNSMLMPARQTSVPVINTATSAVEGPSQSKMAQLESITNSLMPSCTSVSQSSPITSRSVCVTSVSTPVSMISTSTSSTVPLIRVKNLKELS